MLGHVPLSHEHRLSHFSGAGLYPSGVLSSIATKLLGEIWSEYMSNTIRFLREVNSLSVKAIFLWHHCLVGCLFLVVIFQPFRWSNSSPGSLAYWDTWWTKLSLAVLATPVLLLLPSLNVCCEKGLICKATSTLLCLVFPQSETVCMAPMKGGQMWTSVVLRTNQTWGNPAFKMSCWLNYWTWANVDGKWPPACFKASCRLAFLAS